MFNNVYIKKKLFTVLNIYFFCEKKNGMLFQIYSDFFKFRI